MPSVHGIYSNSRLPLSPLIRWRTGAAFSHEGIILESDSDLITPNSLVSHSALSCKGVRFTTVKSFIAHASDYKIVRIDQEINWAQYHELVELTKKYEGLKYDLKGAVGLGIGEDWQEDDAFWCTEWRAFVLKNIGMTLPFLENEHRLNPSHSLQWPQTTLAVNFL